MSQSTEPLSPELDLLAAVAAALDVPLPGGGETAERAYISLLKHRTAWLRGYLDGVTERGVIRRDAGAVRAFAEAPVTYQVQPSAGALAEQRHQLADDAVPSEGAAHPLAVTA